MNLSDAWHEALFVFQVRAREYVEQMGATEWGVVVLVALVIVGIYRGKRR